MRLHWGLALLFTMVLLWATSSVATADKPESVDVGASVGKVTGQGKKARATIDKGKKAGVKVGEVGELYPMRTSEGSTGQSVDFNVRLALGRVVEVKDDSATLALEAVADTVETGAYFSYKVTAPSALTESSLFRVTALGVVLLPQEKEAPFATLEAMLADPSEAFGNKTLDAMIADVKAIKATVAKHLKNRIQEGRHHGKLAGQVVDELDRAQLLDFLLFVEGFPGKYIGHRWRLPEVYFTWVINGTPSGENSRKLRRVSSTIAAANAASASGKLDEARGHWQTVLKSVPDHKAAGEAVSRIDRILLLTRRTVADPDDTAGGYQLMDELFNLGAYELAMKQNDLLRKRSYEPFKVDRLRGYLLTRQKKWKEAEQIFQRLIKENPKDTGLPNWGAYASAQGRIARSPTDPSSHVALAAVHEESKSWDAALTEYRKVLASDRATAKQREAAKLAQERISLQKDLDVRVEWARGDLREHDIKGARERIEQALRLAEKLADAKQAGVILDELAQLARSSGEEELALELLKKRVQSVPDQQGAHTALAFALLGFDRIDEAETAANQSLTLKGDPAYSYLILSYVARARDDLATAEKHATKAVKDSPKYPWPLLVLARVEAARGNWQQATTHARRALELEESYDMRTTHAAVGRGLQAHEALQAEPGSARERLRLIRALADLGLARRVGEEIAKLPSDGTWRTDAWWALAASPDSRLLLRDRLTAARNSKPTAARQKRRLAVLEARAQLRAKPKDDDTRIALARLYIQSQDLDTALATLVPLMTEAMRPAVGDLVRDAREALTTSQQLELGRAAIARSDFDGAIRMSLAAQRVHDRVGTSLGRLTSREIHADALTELGRIKEAIAVIEEARTIAAADGDALTLSILNQRLGRLHANLGTNDALLKALQDGRKLCEDLDDEFSLYFVLVQLAELEGDEGRSAPAIENARKAWSMAERVGRPDLARNARFALADANLSSSRFSDAEQLAVKLLVDSRKHDDVHNEQLSLMVLGAVAIMRGQGKPARARFQEVYDLGTRNGQTAWRALARRYEGTAWLKADHDPARAAVSLEQAAVLYESLGEGWASAVRSGVVRELADALLQSGKLPRARQAAEQSLALAQRFQRVPSLAAAQWILALVAIKEGKADEAMIRSREAVASAEKTDDAALLWNAWHALARAHELKSQDTEAVNAYERTLEHLGRALQAAGGENERQGYMSTGRVRDVYKDAIERFLRAGKTSRAMEILELSRDALLKQHFDPTKIQTRDPKLRAQLKRYEETRARVQGLEKQLDQALDKPAAQRSDAQVKALGERIASTRQQLNQVVLDLKVNHRHLFQALAMDPQNLVGRRQELPTGSVLVQYFVAGDALYAFVVAANLSQPAVVRVKVSSADLEQTIADFRTALVKDAEKKDTHKVEALGRKLDDWLLEPLRAHIDGATTVIVLPFGPLYYVPFDALVVSEPGKPIRYALEDFRISIQTATTLEHLLRPVRARSAGTMLAVSNPDGSLPGAAREVNRIVKTALPDAQVLGRNQATVKKFSDMAGGFRYLHLATHGILDPDPRKSYLKLSDGPLTVEQITQLQGLEQGNEMVVLSACDTAVEKGNSSGDELVSVAVAFSMAGSPSLVASLWEVDDDSTAELMATFYRALEQNPGDRLDALRNAKLNLLRMTRGKDRPFASPWHWSSFQLYGDFRAPGAHTK